jgi:hypothetical protein
MKKTLLLLLLVLAAPVVWGQTAPAEKTPKEQPSKTTTTTSAKGTITRCTPGKTLVLKLDGGPLTYTFGKKVAYVTRAGAVIPDQEVDARLHVGAPVTVYFVKEGVGMTVNRIVLEE